MIDELFPKLLAVGVGDGMLRIIIHDNVFEAYARP
jgi:hypothetical protein